MNKVRAIFATVALSMGLLAGTLSTASANNNVQPTSGTITNAIIKYNWVLEKKYSLSDWAACAGHASKLYQKRDGYYIKDVACKEGRQGYGVYVYMLYGVPMR